MAGRSVPEKVTYDCDIPARGRVMREGLLDGERLLSWWCLYGGG